MKRLLLPILALAFAAAFAAPPADGAVPCWRQVVNDWLADGRIDRIYEDSCYAEALEKIPQDLEEYSSLTDEIALAREAAARGETIDLPGGGADDLDGTDRIGEGIPPLSGGGGGGPAEDRGPLETFLLKVGPKNADELPLPLLVLGAIATILMAAGAAGMVARRTQARRLQGEPPA